MELKLIKHQTHYFFTDRVLTALNQKNKARVLQPIKKIDKGESGRVECGPSKSRLDHEKK
jgi:hypothetical protein